MAISACVPAIQYRTPPLNEADRERLVCSEFAGFEDMLADLPAHAFLSTTKGAPVQTADGAYWVRFDVVQQREARMLKFAGVTARGQHFECFDNLAWLAGVWTDLEKDD